MSEQHLFRDVGTAAHSWNTNKEKSRLYKGRFAYSVQYLSYRLFECVNGVPRPAAV